MNNNRKKELDQFVINIEFLLISVVQGLALSALAAASIEPVTSLQWEYLPYVISGLLFILIFWAEAIIHVLSFIRFPMDMTHNFLYFLAGFVEVIAFSQLTNPMGWFITMSVFVGVCGLLYWQDLKLIRAAKPTIAHTKAGEALYNHIYREQLYEFRVFVPSGIVFNLVVIYLIHQFPAVFITGKYHVALVCLQIMFAVYILNNAMRNFTRRQQLISQVS